jgi:hypothetical protein
MYFRTFLELGHRETKTRARKFKGPNRVRPTAIRMPQDDIGSLLFSVVEAAAFGPSKALAQSTKRRPARREKFGHPCPVCLKSYITHIAERLENEGFGCEYTFSVILERNGEFEVEAVRTDCGPNGFVSIVRIEGSHEKGRHDEQ